MAKNIRVLGKVGTWGEQGARPVSGGSHSGPIKGVCLAVFPALMLWVGIFFLLRR